MYKAGTGEQLAFKRQYNVVIDFVYNELELEVEQSRRTWT